MQMSYIDYIFVILFIFALTGVIFLFLLLSGFLHLGFQKKQHQIIDKTINSLDEAIALTDSTGNILFCNQAFKNIENYKSGINCFALLARSSQSEKFLYRLKNNTTSKKTIQEEIRLETSLFLKTDNSDLNAFWYNISIKSITQNHSHNMIWSIKDITNDRNGHEMFFQNLQEAINNLDQAPAGFISINKSGKIIYLNATFASWIALDLAAFEVGKVDFNDIFSSYENALSWNSIVERQTKTESIQHLNLEIVDAKNIKRPLIGFISEATRSNRDDTIYHIVLTENTNLQTYQTANHDAGELFTQYFNKSPFAIAVIDHNGLLTQVNDRFSKLVLSDNHTTKLPHLTHLVELHGQNQIERALKLIAYGKNEINSIDTVLKDHEDSHIRLYIHPTRYQHKPNNKNFAIVSVIEMNQQKALEDQMAQSQKMQAVGQLAGGIAHDFNNVLTAILMSCDFLLSNHRSSDPSHADLINIKNNANRAAALVQQLLAFSRRQTLRPEMVDLTELLSDSRNLVTPLLGNTIHLKIIHGRDLWNVEVDQASMQRVIMNLVINARDAMPNGGLITISSFNIVQDDIVKLDYPGLLPADYVGLEITDNGTGISEDVQKKMFEPFFTTKEVGKGTGLGLSMVYGIIEQSGGYIYCDSQVGIGTTFRIFFPRFTTNDKITTEIAQNKLAQPIETTKPADLSGTATILLVEDEDAVRMGGVRALQSRGYTVLEASTGVEALEILEQKQGAVDLVVSDVVMPEMDGPTLLGELRKLYPDIKFVFVSGYAKDAFAKNLPEGSVYGFLSKPFSLKQLATTVKEMLESNP